MSVLQRELCSNSKLTFVAQIFVEEILCKNFFFVKNPIILHIKSGVYTALEFLVNWL
jgi:hypothetical protein